MKASKKLIVSVAALVVTVLVATSATFAWFTMNNTPTVDGFDVEVTTGTDGLYISFYNSENKWTEFKSTITKEEILELFRDYSDNTADPTATTNATKLTKMDTATTTNGYEFKKENGDTATNVPGESLYVISFKVKFRASKNYEVYLNGAKDTSAVTSTVDDATYKKQLEVAPDTSLKAWENFFTEDTAAAETAGKYSSSKTNTTFKQAKGETIVARARNAVRVSFATTTAGENPKTTAPIWDPNKTDGYDLLNMAQAYREEVLHMEKNETAPAKAELMPYVDDKTDKPTKLVEMKKATDVDSAYESNELTINIWLEGWDGDCMNNVLTDIFTTSLQFIGIAPAETPAA